MSYWFDCGNQYLTICPHTLTECPGDMTETAFMKKSQESAVVKTEGRQYNHW